MKRLVSFGLAGVLGVAATSALAGQHQVPTVMIDTVQRWAFGGFGAARNSADIKQLIGCDTWTDPSGSSTTCYAQDAAGKNYVTCYTFDPSFREAIRSIKGDSFVQFHWDASGQCTAIEVDDSSAYEPKR